jgi:hypothetical protein
MDPDAKPDVSVVLPVFNEVTHLHEDFARIIEYNKRAGTSKFHWRRGSQRYLAQVVRLVLSYNPLRVFMPIALALIGMTELGFDISDKRWGVGTNTLLMLFAALQVITVGLLADLMVRLTRTREHVDPANR